MDQPVSLAIRAATVTSLVVLAVLHNPLPAWARPGTPDKVKAYPCGPRAICVEFHNTATEKVRIEANMNKRDRRIQLPSSQPECMYRKGVGRNIFHCSPLGSNVECRTGDNIYSQRRHPIFGGRDVISGTCLPHVYKFSNLEPGANYCLQFRARRVSDQMVSQIWSAWACAVPERDPPPAPPPPPKPQIFSTQYYFKMNTRFRSNLFLAPISSGNNSLTHLETGRDNTPNQFWSFSSGDGGGYRIHSALHGRDDCLQLVTSGPDDNHPRIAKCETFASSADAQHWVFWPADGATRIQSRVRPELCLDIYSGGARNNQPHLTKCGNLTGQRWQIKSSGKRVQ